MTTNILGFTALTGGGTGALDAKTSSYYADGSIAFGVVSGVHYSFQYDASETGSENSPYIIIPDDNSSGTGAWILQVPGGAFSHVKARRSTAQSIPNATGTTVIFDVESYDTLGEYDTGTGIFTATYSGIYIASASVSLVSTAWTAGEFLQCEFITSSLTLTGPRNNFESSNTIIAGISLSHSFELSATETLKFNIYQNSGGAVNTYTSGLARMSLTIDRIA